MHIFPVPLVQVVLDEEEFGIESDMPPITSTEITTEDVVAPPVVETVTTVEETVAPVVTSVPVVTEEDVSKETDSAAVNNSEPAAKDTKAEGDVDPEEQKRAARAAKFGIPLKEKKAVVQTQKKKQKQQGAVTKVVELTAEQVAAQAAVDEKKRLRAERFGIPVKETPAPATAATSGNKKRNRHNKKSEGNSNVPKPVDPAVVNNSLCCNGRLAVSGHAG